jgi:hypothetical protein
VVTVPAAPAAPAHLLAEFPDSTPLRGDPAALRARLRTDGYLFFRGLLDREVVTRAAAVAYSALRADGWIAAEGPPEHAPIVLPPRLLAKYSSPQGSAGPADRWTDAGYRRFASSAQFNRLPYESSVRDLMRAVVGPSCFSYPFKVFRIRYPHSAVPVHDGNYVHTDYAVVGVQDMFTMWVPLIDLDGDFGGLAVRPGSFRLGLKPLCLLDPSELGWATADYRAGDVLVFHCLTAHAALPNRTDRLRLSAEFRWQLGTEPVPRRLIFGQPPAAHEVWSRHFSSLPWWEPVPSDLTFIDLPPRPVIRSIPPSRFVDVPELGPFEYQLGSFGG